MIQRDTTQKTKLAFGFVGHSLVALSATCLVGLGAVGCGGSSGSGGFGGGSASTAAPVVSGSAQMGDLQGLTTHPGATLQIENDLGAGFQLVIDGEYKDSNGKTFLVDVTRDVDYAVEDSAIAKVSGDGLIEPVAVGTTKVTITYKGQGSAVIVSVAPPSGVTPTYKQVSIFPPYRNLPLVNPVAKVEQLQQIVVVGTDDKGVMHDLTRSLGVTLQDKNGDPTFLANNSPNGLIRAVANGEVIAVARLNSAGLVSGAHFVLGTGQAKPVDPNSLYSGAPLAGSQNPIDVAVLSNLFKQFIEPAKLSADGEFLRRLYADAMGRTPTEAETEAFLSSADATKREKEIDKVLASPAFAKHWAGRIGEWFEMSRVGTNAARAADFDTWAETAINADKTLADMVKELATGSVASFEDQHDDAAKKAGVFLQTGAGMSAKCATCHDHPLVGPNDTIQWKQSELYPLIAFFATSPNEATVLDGKTMVRSGAPLQPGFVLDASATVTTTLQDPIAQRRTEFGNLFTGSDAFNRGLAHRIFAEVATPLLNPNQFLAKELDGVSVPNVLAALTSAFATEKSSLKGFLKVVFTSNYYQLTSNAKDLDTQFDPLLQRRNLRRIHAEVAQSAISEVTGAAITGGDLTFLRQTMGYPFSREAITERSEAVNMSQALLLNNSPVVQGRISGAKITGLATDVTANTITQTEAINKIFRMALSRDASADEIKCAEDAIGAAGDIETGLQDVTAAVLGSAEFLLQ